MRANPLPDITLLSSVRADPSVAKPERVGYNEHDRTHESKDSDASSFG
jgi:hypothetical protein